MRALFLVVMVSVLSGCSMFTPPIEKPVIEDHASNWFGDNKVNIFSTTAERRETIIKFPDGKFCSEPPPDVAQALTSSFTLLAQGTVKDATANEVTARLEATKALATTIRSLFSRSQGIQLFRDGTFHLCQAYLNGSITKEEYKAMFESLLEKSTPLIQAEIPDMKEKRVDELANNADTAASEAKAAAQNATTSAQKAKQDADRAEAAAKKN